jgi:acetyl-CoA C-acetyltransferase
MSNDAIVILNGARTPMGGFQGILKDMSASDLGAAAIKAAVERSGVSVDDIDEVIMGCI